MADLSFATSDGYQQKLIESGRDTDDFGFKTYLTDDSGNPEFTVVHGEHDFKKTKGKKPSDLIKKSKNNYPGNVNDAWGDDDMDTQPERSTRKIDPTKNYYNTKVEKFSSMTPTGRGLRDTNTLDHHTFMDFERANEKPVFHPEFDDDEDSDDDDSDDELEPYSPPKKFQIERFAIPEPVKEPQKKYYNNNGMSDVKRLLTLTIGIIIGMLIMMMFKQNSGFSTSTIVAPKPMSGGAALPVPEFANSETLAPIPQSILNNNNAMFGGAGAGRLIKPSFGTSTSIPPPTLFGGSD